MSHNVTAVETPTRIELEPRVKAVAVVVSAVASPVVPPRTARGRRTVLAAALIVLLANVALSLIGEYSPRLKDPAYGDKWAKLRRQLADRPDEPLVLSLGSSRTLLGFHGQHAENELGGRVIAFNFGTPAAGPVTELVYLRRLFDSGAKPDLLLVEVMPGLCADGPGGPSEQLTLNGERLCRSEVAVVERYGFGPDTRRAWRDSVLVPWSKLRFQLLGRVVPSWVPWNLRFDWSRGADAHGWATPPRQEVTAEERAEREANARREYGGSMASVSPDGRPFAALRELLRECNRREIPTRLVLYPEGSPFRAMYPVGTGERFIAAVRELAVECRAPLTDARDWLPDEAMYDGHHMFKAGAERFTTRLVNEVIAPAVRRSP